MLPHSSNWEAAIEAEDQLVIVSTVREDTAASAAWLIDGRREEGHGNKVREAVTVLSSPSRLEDPQLNRRLHFYFGSLTRADLEVPRDQTLVAGSALHYGSPAPATRDAWLRVTAAVSEKA